MYFLWQASCAATTIATTTATARTATSSIRSAAACWLFLLTLISMQHHRLNRDCCQGAAILMQQQYPPQQQQRAAPLQKHSEYIYKDASGLAINSKVTQPSGSAEQLAAKQSVNKVTNTITTNKKRTELTENAEYLKNSNNKEYLAKITAAKPADFINDAPAAGKSRALAWDDPETLLHRRHIVPEKLQYTSEISIKQGRLVGIIRHMQLQTGLRDVNQYLGLPYAEAPVGSRRFMPPGAPLPWHGLKTARHLPPVCPQKLPDLTQQGAAKMPRGRYKQLTRLLPYLKNENEDCLYLNVYVPREEGLEQTPLYPVLVYIHGESFEWNSGNAYDGSVLASYGQVIVVTVNYRLGVLGFMKPSINERTVANFGLLDQIAALHWIKENIAYFGGDRESVTLMGHSTGAACVNYLMVSPVASGLFHRAILMSGSAMSDWAASNHSLQLTMQIAHQLDCPLMDDNDEMIDCLRSKRYQDILKISPSFPQFSTSLGPIVDGHVIPNQPYKVMGQYTELFSRYDLLFGITELESFHTLGALALEEGLRENERDNLLRFYMQSRYDVRPDLALAATLKKYNDMYNNPIKATNMEHRDVVLDILSDARIVGPLMQTGLFHADVNSHNYMYVFGHNSAAGPHASLPHSIAGEELAFVFGAPLAPSGPFHNSYNTQEKLLSEAVMAYWTNFAKTGNPKAPWKGTFINLHAMEWDRYDLDWPEFNKRTQAYINIGIPPSIGYKYRQIYMNFWNKELPDELNQIATMQQQPFLLAYNGNHAQVPRGGTSLQPPRGMPGEVITGHMSKFGNRDNGAEDPVRTLKLLLQEPYGKSAATINAETAENMYNAPPTFGVAKQQTEDELLFGGATHAQSTQPAVWGIISNVGGSSTATTAANNVEPHALPPPPHLADTEQELAKSESTMQLLIGLIIVFIVLNLAIYATFLLQKRRKKSVHTVMRKLGGAGGILSYDGNTDDELKRSKHTTHDGDDNSYILDIVRKSNTYEAVKTERSPINGYKITRQLSCSTVDTHTKVCEWMAGGAAGCASTLKREGIKKTSKHSSSSPTFSTLHGGGSSGGGSFQPRAHKFNVAIDATPQARGQQPIELTKQQKLDRRNIIICQEMEVEDQELLMPDAACCAGSNDMLMRQHSATTEPCDCVLPKQHDEQHLPISHKHSRSDPVELIYELHKQDEQITSFIQPATPPDINVTSRDDEQFDNVTVEPLSAAQQLALIKRRNYPKVLPTLYKRNSLPPNGLMLQQIMAYGKQQPPMPPPRTISTLGRKTAHGHTPDRRCSGGITTSPVMLAKDFSVAEEDEPQQMTENTLIVGPIVPKLNYSMSMLRRQKQNAKNEPAEQLGHLDHNEAAETKEAALGNVLDAVKRKPSTLRLPTMFSFESQPQPLRDSHTLSPLAHHTEAVYAIQPLNLTASMPSMPAMTPTTPVSPTFNFFTAPSTPVDAAGTSTDGVIYAQSSKVSNKNKHNNLVTAATEGVGTTKSQIPRMLQAVQDVVGSTSNNMTATTTTAAIMATATAASSAATTTMSASRIPQLNRSLNTYQQQQQINKNHSTAAVDDKTATQTATTTAATSAMQTTSSTANLQSPPSIAAATRTTGSSSKAVEGTTSNCSTFSPNTSSLRALSSCSSNSSSCNSSRSSATSSASSTTSSSSSSTGTVRTELKQK